MTDEQRRNRPGWGLNYRAYHAVAVLAALGAAACTARRSEPVAGPFINNDPKVQSGRLVFLQNCNKCHPGGEGGLGPGLNHVPFPRFAQRLQIRYGLGAMPAFGRDKITDRQLDALLAYLKALRKHNG